MISVFAAFDNAVATTAKTFHNGNELYSKCIDQQSAFNRGYCMGFIVAISDSMTTNTLDGFTACFPNGTNAGQMRDVAVMYFQKHPESRHFSADSMVARAFHEAFPCR